MWKSPERRAGHHGGADPKPRHLPEPAPPIRASRIAINFAAVALSPMAFSDRW